MKMIFYIRGTLTNQFEWRKMEPCKHPDKHQLKWHRIN